MNLSVQVCLVLLTFLVIAAFCFDQAVAKPKKPKQAGKTEKPDKKSGSSGDSGSSGNSEKADLKKSRYTEGCECDKKEEPVCSTRQQTYTNECILKCRGGKVKHKGNCSLQSN